jgi:hypothetical protein
LIACSAPVRASSFSFSALSPLTADFAIAHAPVAQSFTDHASSTQLGAGKPEGLRYSSHATTGM